MASERDINQRFAQAPENEPVKDTEGRDTGVEKATQGFDRQRLAGDNDNRLEPSGKAITPTGLEQEFTQAEEGNAAPNIEGVMREKTEHGWAYFVAVPPEAKEFTEHHEDRIHIGDDDGSGSNLAAITESATSVRAALFKEIEEGRTKRQAEMRNLEVGPDGHLRNSNEAEEIIITEGHNLNPNPVDNPDAFDRQMEEYNRIQAQQTREQTRVETQGNDNQDTGQNVTQPSEPPTPENIPIEAAGSPEYAVREQTGVPDEESIIPQEARDTPHKPLDPNNPPPHILGVIPPGEWVAEPQRIPGQPSGPEIEP